MSRRRGLTSFLELPVLDELVESIDGAEPLEGRTAAVSDSVRRAYAAQVVVDLHEQADAQLQAIRSHAQELAKQLADLVESERRVIRLVNELYRVRGGSGERGMELTVQTPEIGRRELARAENQDWPE